MSEWDGRGDRESISKFNPAAFKMGRLNYITEDINNAIMNPEEWNILWRDWNYNVYFKAITRIFKEARPKFTEDEIKKCEEMKKAIEECMKKYPIQKRISINKWSKVNKERLIVFLKYLERYEDVVRKFQETHGLDTPNLEDDEGL